jgi:parallel beta-helix repeat protein
MTDHVSVMSYGATGDGSTNDTAAFASALATGKPVFVPKTTAAYMIADLDIPANSIILGAGDKSLIRPHSSVTSFVFDLGSNDDILISGLAFDVDKTSHSGVMVIHGEDCTRVTVRDCVLEEAGEIGIHLVRSTDCTIDKVTVKEYVSHGILFGTTSSYVNTNCRVLDCVVETAESSAHGIMIQAGRRCLVQGNSATGGGCFGIHFEGCEHSTIIGNTTANTYREGISLLESKFCAVADNRCYWDGEEGVDFGISMWGETAPCSYNVISGNTVVNSSMSGIAIAGTEEATSLNHVTGNTIINCNRAEDAEGAGVLVYGDASFYNFVSDNQIFDDAANLRFGVNDGTAGGAPTGTVMRNNQAIGNYSSFAIVNPAATAITALNYQGLRAYTPASVAPGTGAFGSAPTVVAKYYEVDRLVFLTVSITVASNGTGATDVRIDLPHAAASYSGADVSWVLAGRTEATSGAMLLGVIADGATSMRIFRYDNAYPVTSNGSRLVLSGFYERA